MARRYVRWCSVHTNGVTLRRIALQNIRRSSCTLNCLALHEIFRFRGESSSLLVAWRESYLAETTRNKNRKWNSDLLEGMTSSNVKIDAKPLCTWCSRCFEESSLRLVVKQSQFVTFWYVLFFSPGDIAIIRCCSFGVPRIMFAIKAFRYHFDWKMSKQTKDISLDIIRNIGIGVPKIMFAIQGLGRSCKIARWLWPFRKCSYYIRSLWNSGCSM